LKMRLILLAPLLALFAFVATTEQQAEAVSIGAPVQGELMDTQLTGTSVVNDPMYQNGQALKFFSIGATATETVTFPANSGLHDVELLARASQSGGSPTLRVSVVSVNGTFTAEAQAIDNRLAPELYTFDVNAPSGSSVKIVVQADNTATGRNAFVDVLSFPSSGGSTTPTDTDGDGVPDSTDQCDNDPGPAPTGCPADPDLDSDGDTIPDTVDNCPDVYNKGQADDDGDGVGNKCENGTTPPIDTDGDGVPDSTDNCPNVSNTNQNDGDGDGVGNACDDGSTTPPPSSDWPASDCEVEIKGPGVDIDNIINSDSPSTATTFCVYAGSYTVSTQATLKAGDKLKGEPGTWTWEEGRARVPAPEVMLKGSGSDNLLRADGNGISISWVDLTGASGTGNGTGAIAAGSAGTDFVVEYSRIHDNASLGISNMKGTVRYTEFFKNSNAPSSLGFNGSAVKGITEYEADGVYVHEEQGNGLWCDVGCTDSARNMTDACPTESTGCFWVHDSVVVDSNRAGIRYENSSSEALFENNVIRGNGITEHRGGIDIRDSQDAEVRSNILSDNNGIGVRATDSGRSDRVDLDNILVQGNNLGGDRIINCGGPVACISNTQVGTK
jgi:hypothetical protein